MNGQWLGTRAIRTNWATRKPPAPKDGKRFFVVCFVFLALLNSVGLAVAKLDAHFGVRLSLSLYLQYIFSSLISIEITDGYILLLCSSESPWSRSLTLSLSLWRCRDTLWWSQYRSLNFLTCPTRFLPTSFYFPVSPERVSMDRGRKLSRNKRAPWPWPRRSGRVSLKNHTRDTEENNIKDCSDAKQ